MYGLINRAFQSFVTDTYGLRVWRDSVNAADLGVTKFEALMKYPDDMTVQLLSATSERLGRSAEELAEDLGIYLIVHSNSQSLRRLLRFGGTSFSEFLYSLNDLPDRARLALPDLVVPRMELLEPETMRFVLQCEVMPYPAGHVVLGALRAMADDYGALASLEYRARSDLWDTIDIAIYEVDYSPGRDFELAAPVSRR